LNQRLRDLIGRNMLFPALRVMRAQMRLVSDPVKLREAAASVDALGRPDSDVRTEEVTAGTVAATWIKVQGVRTDGVVLYLHGGAFITETPMFHGALLSRICRTARARGLMVRYRLAPEHQYPQALDDCVGAYRWLLTQGYEANRVTVAGDSAGGNLTLALLLRLRDEGLPLPAGAVALSPVTDLTFSGDSVRRNDGIDDMFSADLMDGMVPVYLASPDLRTDPYVSPVFGDFAGLPPLLLIVGSTELLLDDSVRVAQRWPSATLLVWHGMPHVFPGFDFLPEAREATQRISQFVRDCLSGSLASPVSAAQSAETDPEELAATVRTLPHHARPRLTVKAQAYLAAAVLTGCIWLAVVAFGMGPLLLLVHPIVWAAALATGTAWALFVFLFLRASLGATTRAKRPRG
jgi:acetyl esterase/lipase